MDNKKKKNKRERFVVELGGKSITLIGSRDVQHYAFRCNDHSVEEMPSCPFCWMALKSIGELAPYRPIRKLDATEFVEHWRVAMKEAA